MGDGKELYTFGFSDVTGVDPNQAIDQGILNAQFPAPTLSFKEGDEAYVTLTNVGMIKRPDLFDPHSVHFHGFPNAGTVFDGVPESSISINMGFSLTYYYKIQEPGTFMYHCHVEASEHMQMGMLGNLFVDPAQNGTMSSVATASSSTTIRTVPRVTTCSRRSRSVRSTATSTSSTSACSRCRSRKCATTTRC